MNFHSHFSYDFSQNPATTFEHMKKFIHWMYKENVSIKYGIIYDTTDVYTKQYRCENALWILSVLSFTYRVIIDRCINYPGCGRIKLDVINVSNK